MNNNTSLNIIFLILAFFMGTLCFGQQTPENAQKEINSIKSSKNYLFAESTTKTWDEAYENARMLLSQYIEDWIKSRDKNADVAGYVAKSENKILEIKAKRGSLFRAFVYVKKADIMTYTNNEDLLGLPLQEPSENYIPASEVSNTVGNVNQTTQPSQEHEYSLTAQDNLLLQLNDVKNIQDFLKKNANEYFKLSSLPSDRTCYVIIFDKEKIRHYILHRPNDTDINLETCKSDNIDNYKGIGMNALGFIFKH